MSAVLRNRPGGSNLRRMFCKVEGGEAAAEVWKYFKFIIVGTPASVHKYIETPSMAVRYALGRGGVPAPLRQRDRRYLTYAERTVHLKERKEENHLETRKMPL